jgi:hypothetical protein
MYKVGGLDLMAFGGFRCWERRRILDSPDSKGITTRQHSLLSRVVRGLHRQICLQVEVLIHGVSND